jgi:hypothetical protein
MIAQLSMSRGLETRQTLFLRHDSKTQGSKERKVRDEL